MNKRLLGSLAFSLLGISLFGGAVSAQNPIISHKYTADPSALATKNRIYVYCTSDEDNRNNYNIINYTLVSSDDMVNWTDHGEVFKVKDVSKWATQAYAPSCVERDGKFFLYYPDGGNAVGVAVADKPEGPFTDPLGKALVDKKIPNCENVTWLFDPCAFVDDDGQAYLTFGGGSRAGSNFRIVKLKKDMITLDGPVLTLNTPRSFEASYLHKYNKKYYLSYSTSGQTIDYMMSDKPMEGYVDKGTVLGNPPKNLGNNNHHSLVEFKGQWYAFYHSRPVSNAVYKRSVCVDLLKYNEDGTMAKVVFTAQGAPQIKKLNPFETVQAETIAAQKGIETVSDKECGMVVSDISEGDWIKVRGVDFDKGAKSFEAKVAAEKAGTLELRLGSDTGDLVGTCKIEPTGGLTTWKNVSCDVKGAEGVKDLVLVFKGEGFRVDSYKFTRSN